MKNKKTGSDHREWVRMWQAMEKLCASHRNSWDGWCALVVRRTCLVGRATAQALARSVLITAMFMQYPAFATGSVTLAWNPSQDPTVAGYKVYYGGVSQYYTNEIDVGDITNASVAGLVGGATYYFAATTYTAEGLESAFSDEVPYLVPNAAVLAIHVIMSNGIPASLSIVAGGSVPNQWTLQSSPDLRTWTAIAQGTNLAVNLLVPVGGLPRQFFRLTGQ
jgi:hypothetical protein